MDILSYFPAFWIPDVPRGRYTLWALLTVFLLLTITGCSTSIAGNEHLDCSPEVHFINHSMICTKQPPGDWPYQCVVKGNIENKGAGRASAVLVWVEFGRQLNGVRNSTFNPIGDLDPGEKADFNNEIPAYELPSQYDIKITCTNYASNQPSNVPPQMGLLTSPGPAGSAVTTLAIDPANPANLYAGTTAWGLFKSTDGGGTWTESNLGVKFFQVNDLAIDPFTPTTIYASILSVDTGYPNGALYKSTDRGEHWFSVTEVMGSVTMRSITFDPVKPGTIYAITENGLIKSVDSGSHWQALNLGSFGPYISNLVIDPLTPATLYALSPEYGVIKSTNGGEEWFEGNNGLPNFDLTSLVIDPVTPAILYTISWKGVFQTKDATMNWSMVNRERLDASAIIVTAFAIDPLTPTNLYAALYLSNPDSAKIMKSTDEGKTWEEFNVGRRTSYISSIVIDSANPTMMYLLTNSGLVFVQK